MLFVCVLIPYFQEALFSDREVRIYMTHSCSGRMCLFVKWNIFIEGHEAEFYGLFQHESFLYVEALNISIILCRKFSIIST